MSLDLLLDYNNVASYNTASIYTSKSDYECRISWYQYYIIFYLIYIYGAICCPILGSDQDYGGSWNDIIR